MDESIPHGQRQKSGSKDPPLHGQKQESGSKDPPLHVGEDVAVVDVEGGFFFAAH